MSYFRVHFLRDFLLFKVLYSTLLHLSPQDSILRLNPGLLRLRHRLSDPLTTRLELIYNSARSHPISARSHPHSARPHPRSARTHTHSARSHSHPHSAIELIHTRLDLILIHTRPELIHLRLDFSLIHTPLNPIHISARSHPCIG